MAAVIEVESFRDLYIHASLSYPNGSDTLLAVIMPVLFLQWPAQNICNQKNPAVTSLRLCCYICLLPNLPLMVF